MIEFVEVKASDLTGPALDWAVAHATKAWEFAHEWFPTMTLDPRFSGVRDYIFDGCVWLEPNNPFRQDPQPFRPSTDWSQGGPLWDEWATSMEHYDGWLVAVVGGDAQGHTKLIALCRAIVSAKLGDVVQVPKELI